MHNLSTLDRLKLNSTDGSPKDTFRTGTRLSAPFVVAGEVMIAGLLAFTLVRGFRSARPSMDSSIQQESNMSLPPPQAVPGAANTPANSGQGASPDNRTWLVKKHETLSLISGRTGVSISEICSANAIADPDFIMKGQVLTIPPRMKTATGSGRHGQAYRIKPGESLWSIARKLNTTVDALKQANSMQGELILAGRQISIPVSTGR